MKKLILIALVALGSFGFAGAHAAPGCAGPVTVGGCTYTTPTDGQTHTCRTLWVEVGKPADYLDGCVIN